VREWLSSPPPEKLLETWARYIKHLCRKIDPARRASLQQGLLANARRVADAVGGVLGFGDRISVQERAVLEKLAEAFAEIDAGNMQP